MYEYTYTSCLDAECYLGSYQRRKERVVYCYKKSMFLFFFDTNVGILLSKPLAVKCFTSALLKVEWVLREGKTKSL